MAEKRYKITADIVGSQNYQAESAYKFRTGFQKGPPLQICQAPRCPVITCDENDVLGTTNEWAQRCMEASIIPKGIQFNGQNVFGPPGEAVFEETTDPVTIDLDQIFGSV